MSKIYGSTDTEQCESFANDVSEQMGSATFDDATNIETLNIPESLQTVIDDYSTGNANRDSMIRGSLLSAVYDGIQNFESEHGVKPSGDVIEHALHQAYSTSPSARNDLDQEGKAVFDEASAMSGSHDQSSMQPNRAIVAITASISEAIPVANYMPADISSNEAKLIIVGHKAGSAWGDYAENDSLDGTNSGGNYISSERLIELDAGGKGVFYAINGDDTSPKLKLTPNRLQIRVNGLVAGGETPKQGAGIASSPLTGSVVLDGVTHVLSGVYKSADSEVTATFTPALPANSKVTAIGIVDYEHNPELTPKFITHADKFSLFANTWQARAEHSLEARSQFSNESGVDIASEALMAIRHQYANERHYQVIRMLEAVGEHNAVQFDYNRDLQVSNKTRARVWVDLLPKLSELDQKVANITQDHGITTLYVDDLMRSQLIGLPDTMFQSSGITARAGIYRIGKVFGLYDVYYNPRAKKMPAGSSRIVCAGRSQQVARNPVCLGDAVAPTVIPFLLDKNFKNGAGYHARTFTQLNPHQESAQGCGVIDIVNIA